MCLLAVLAVSSLSMGSTASAQAAQAVPGPGDISAEVPARPNIVLIMADDVGWEAIGCYGAQSYQTPHIDGLAAAGVRFEHCYSTPICTPSRVMIMTGQQSFRNYTHFGYLSPKERTFGHLMRDAGYRTAIAGKWQLNGLYNELPGHDDRARPRHAGFDEYCLWQLTLSRTAEGERYWSPPLETNGELITTEENLGRYGPDIFCEFVCDFMEANRDEPFFVYYPMVLPHGPFVATPDTIGDAPRTQAANVQGRPRKAPFMGMVSYMDQLVGRVVAKTEALGIAENTLIIFTSDNGTSPQINSRWNDMTIVGGKGTMTDMGTHVPLIAYRKGATPEGETIADIVDFTDVYPTLAETAGIDLSEEDPVDGQSFAAQLLGEAGDPREWVFCHYQPYWDKSPGQYVRTADYKLYRDGRFVQPAVDLKEENDLADFLLGEKARVYARLAAVLKQAPPAPKDPHADRNTKDRPVFPEWKRLPTEPPTEPPK